MAAREWVKKKKGKEEKSRIRGLSALGVQGCGGAAPPNGKRAPFSHCGHVGLLHERSMKKQERRICRGESPVGLAPTSLAPQVLDAVFKPLVYVSVRKSLN